MKVEKSAALLKGVVMERSGVTFTAFISGAPGCAAATFTKTPDINGWPTSFVKPTTDYVTQVEDDLHTYSIITHAAFYCCGLYQNLKLVCIL